MDVHERQGLGCTLCHCRTAPGALLNQGEFEDNSEIAVCMRTTLQNKMCELLINQQEGIEEIQRYVPEYATADVDTQLFYERPYLETSALSMR